MEIYSDWYYKHLEYDGPETSQDCNNDGDDDFDPFYDEEKEREEEAKMFTTIPKQGVHAHAYRQDLDNLKMKKLRKKGFRLGRIFCVGNILHITYTKYSAKPPNQNSNLTSLS